MQITNTQRNTFIANLLALDLTPVQLKFIIYLMNLTFNVQKISLYIPSIFKLAEILGYDQKHFSKQVKQLIDYDIILRNGKNYTINLDAKIWQTNKDQFSKIFHHQNKLINSQLNKLN